MLFNYLRNRRRARVKLRPFPPDWERILARRFPLFTHLPESDQQELRGHIQVFLEEKSFEGCGGLNMTDEIRVTIAAEACLLLLHRETDYYHRLASVLVYPHHFVSNASAKRAGNGIVTEDRRAHLGESWSTGSIILSWQTIEQDSANGHDGHNVIYHEFAHQLDLEDGQVTGAPALGEHLSLNEKRRKFAHWAQVLQAEFDHLQFHHRHGHRTLIDSYGAESPAEFFAVCVETFFEKPLALRSHHLELYAELKDYFQQDPASWDVSQLSSS